jgi:hypothetical protein
MAIPDTHRNRSHSHDRQREFESMAAKALLPDVVILHLMLPRPLV